MTKICQFYIPLKTESYLKKTRNFLDANSLVVPHSVDNWVVGTTMLDIAKIMSCCHDTYAIFLAMSIPKLSPNHAVG